MKSSWRLPLGMAALVALLPVLVVAAGADPGRAGHTDPFSFILLELGFMLGIAMFGRWAAGRFKQPAVLGELLLGVIVGNVGYWLGLPLFVLVMHLSDAAPIFEQLWSAGTPFPQAAGELFGGGAAAAEDATSKVVEVLRHPDAARLVPMVFALWVFSNLGVILLLFVVGLESSVSEMRRVGVRALLVALIGVVAPFVLGLFAGRWLLPDAGTPAHVFLAATLCATSVGITARVFKDLGRIHTPEAKVILGAAVIDDVLGLIILAVVVGIAATGEVDLGEVAKISALSFVFLGGVLLFGERIVEAITPFFASLDRHHGKLLFPLAVACLMGWLASSIQLASIVGAFAAGLILSEEHFAAHSDHPLSIHELIAPLEAIFAPVFFVLMGMQVNLATLADPSIVAIALALTAVAIIGKIVSGLAADPATDRLSVGIGMIPRGEVGLIFASIGKSVGVVSDALFSTIVIVVMITTLITPIGLRWSLFRAPREPRAPRD